MASPPLCSSCGQAPRKYKCPSCERALCSLQCSKAHKVSCAGASESRAPKTLPSLPGPALPLPVDTFDALTAQHPALRQRLQELYKLLQQADSPKTTESEAQRARATVLQAIRQSSHEPADAGRKRKKGNRNDERNMDEGLAAFVRAVKEHTPSAGA